MTSIPALTEQRSSGSICYANLSAETAGVHSVGRLQIHDAWQVCLVLVGVLSCPALDDTQRSGTCLHKPRPHRSHPETPKTSDSFKSVKILDLLVTCIQVRLSYPTLATLLTAKEHSPQLLLLHISHCHLLELLDTSISTFLSGSNPSLSPIPNPPKL
jgi:hypothetical protein